jgi:predicted GNAT family acetyltransferase
MASGVIQRVGGDGDQERIHWGLEGRLYDSKLTTRVYVNGICVGKAWANFSDAFNSLTIQRVDVKSAYEGRGFGTKLMLNICEEALHYLNGDAEVQLVADGEDHNGDPRDLRPYYSTRGFTWDKEEKNDKPTQYTMKGKLGAVIAALKLKTQNPAGVNQ